MTTSQTYLVLLILLLAAALGAGIFFGPTSALILVTSAIIVYTRIKSMQRESNLLKLEGGTQVILLLVLIAVFIGIPVLFPDSRLTDLLFLIMNPCGPNH